MKKLIFIVILCVIAVPAWAVLSSSNLTYIGAFRLPTTDTGTVKWQYGGKGLAFRPEGNSGAGSLLSAGRNYNTYTNERDIGEFTIPTPVINTSIDNLNRATMLQTFTDITEGDFDAGCEGTMASPNEVRGLTYIGQSDGLLYISFWDSYNTGQEDICFIGYADIDFVTNPNYQGSWWLDDADITEHSKDYAGYLFNIPASWANTYLSGKRIATGQSREGGAYCRGPGLWAIDPGNYSNISPPTNDKLPAKALIFYATTEGDNFTNYTTCDQYYGAAWVEAGGDAAIIYVGTHCEAGCYYDNAYICPSAQTHQLIFYDPDDLVAVAQGTVDPWDVSPVETKNLADLISYHLPGWTHAGYARGGVAYDATGNRLYILQNRTDGSYPLVHVFSITQSSTPASSCAFMGVSVGGS